MSSKVDRSFGRPLLSALTLGVVLIPAAVTVPVATASVAASVVTSDTISTEAGTGVAGALGDGGPAANAQLNTPRDIDVGPDGSLYVADMSNNKIRKIAPDGTISTVVGTGVAGSTGDGGLATGATIKWPHDILIDDSTGILYVPDSNNCRIRQVDTNGVISPFAGTGVCGYGGDGGDARLAKLKYPKGVAVYGGAVYIADSVNNRIRKVDLATHVITTVAGTGTTGYSGDGGPALAATFNVPQRLAFDTAGNLYVADDENNAVRRIDTTGTITTVVGTGAPGSTGDGGPGTLATLTNPRGITVGGSTLYFSDTTSNRVRALDLVTGVVTAVAGTGVAGYTGDGGPAGSARLRNPRGLAVDNQGRLLITDTFNNVIRLVTPAGGDAAPVAAFTVDCSGASCAFNGSESSDDGTITAYSWTFGDGSSAVGVAPRHTYLGAGTYSVTLTVTDNAGQTGTARRSITIDLANVPPTAVFTTSCTGLDCSFDARASSDPDGSITAYSWQFGDGAAGIGITAQHAYATAGRYQVALTVTDDKGTTASTSRVVMAGAPQLSFAGKSSANSSLSTTTLTVTVPPSVQPGDALLLFETDNGTGTTATAPVGWSLVGSTTTGMATARLWQRVAAAADAGTTITVRYNAYLKSDVELLAYRGTSSTTPVLAWSGRSDAALTAAHATPTATVAGSGCWAVSYWSDKSSTTSSWAAPEGQTVRDTLAGTGTAHIAVLVTDSAGAVPGGSYGGLLARTNATSRGLMITAILAPAG